jgi:hypothetical protein
VFPECDFSNILEFQIDGQAHHSVIPAKAGTHATELLSGAAWDCVDFVPACAGMTEWVAVKYRSSWNKILLHPRDHFCKAFLRQDAGVRVVARAVIAVEEPEAADLVDGAVCEGMLRAPEA